jgi:two-component system sensor histidine kinase/response regulator
MAPEERDEKASNDPGDWEGQGGVVLVVDDSEWSRGILASLLDAAGYEVQTASGGAEALRLIARTPPDIVLLDLMMPDVDGLEVLERVRANPATVELPVIMVSAFDQARQVVMALERGANDYIPKPCDMMILLARVRTQIKLKQLQDQRRRDIQRLRELDAFKDRFLQIAAHDLKNPLTHITLGAGLLRETDLSTPQGRTEFEGIIDFMELAAQVMQTIISDFLDFRALQTGSLTLHPEPIALNDLVRRIVNQYSLSAEKRQIVLGAALDPALPECQADPDRLTQAISNYLSNAIKFSPDGTQVILRTRPAEGGFLRVEIEDNGPGIPEEEMPLLFEEFARLSNKPLGGEKSSGIGLSIVRRLIELHGGRVGAERRAEGGMRFWLEIPPEPPAPSS